MQANEPLMAIQLSSLDLEHLYWSGTDQVWFYCILYTLNNTTPFS